MLEAVGLSIVTGSTASVVGDRRREVLELAVDAHGDDGAVGEQGEAVGHLNPLLESVYRTLQL